jgi:hypothetical protein
MRLRELYKLLGAVVLVGCASTTAVEEIAGACRQTFEFGNYGCIVIVGTVTGPVGQQLSGTWVSIGAGGDRVQFGGGFDTTKSDGRYQLRAIRVVRDPGSSDSVALWIHAVRIPRSAAPSAPTLRDSSLVRLSVTPIGAVPPATPVNLSLPDP